MPAIYSVEEINAKTIAMKITIDTTAKTIKLEVDFDALNKELKKLLGDDLKNYKLLPVEYMYSNLVYIPYIQAYPAYPLTPYYPTIITGGLSEGGYAGSYFASGGSNTDNGIPRISN